VNQPSPNWNASFWEGEIVRNTAEIHVLAEELRKNENEFLGEGAIEVAVALVCPEGVAAVEAAQRVAEAKKGLDALNMAEKYRRLSEDREYGRWLEFWFRRYNPHGSHYTYESPSSQTTGPAYKRFVQRYAAKKKACGKGRKPQVEEACQALREIVDLNRRALKSREVTASPAWRTAEDRVFKFVDQAPQPATTQLRNIWGCHCPIVTGRRMLEQWWRLREMDRTPPPGSSDDRSHANRVQAMETTMEHVLTEFRQTEACYKKACEARQ